MSNLFDVCNKVAVVTGGGRGIGLLIARSLVSVGVKVYIASRSKESINKTVDELNKLKNGSCEGFVVDLGTVEGCQHLAKEIAKKESKVNILVNNSGNNWAAPIDNYPQSGFDKVINLNLRAPFFLTTALLPLLRAAGTPDDPARVINISSIAGNSVPFLETYAYSASKAGLTHLTKHMASRLARDNITVNAILPGAFDTKMMKETLEKHKETILSGIPLGRIGKESDIGSAVIFLASLGASWITGAELAVDGGALVRASL